MAVALEMTQLPDSTTLAQILKDRFLTFHATRKFVEDHDIHYRLTTDIQP